LLLIRLATLEDVDALLLAADELFDNLPQREWTTAFLSQPGHHLLIAVEGAEVIGFVSAVRYLHPDKPPEMWINEVGVVESHQGRGVGTRLMEGTLALARELGCTCAWVLTDEGNEAAKRLYARAGGVRGEPATVLYEFPLAEGLSDETG
jgi:ribosomal protein S18 acetylase RimI-like enzyme